MKIKGYKCLILDKRIIDILNSGMYAELVSLKQINEYNKYYNYLEYLKLVNKLANRMHVKIDQIEYFLFHFGKNIKNLH